MITYRPAAERGTTDAGWLDSRHTFSFADYSDPAHDGFRKLRVLNDDRVAPGAGFPTHPHREMEIVSYVLDGALEHSDSLGTGSVIRPSDVQRMSAGTGVTHSEWNGSKTDPVHFLQIWIYPETRGIRPGYEQVTFPPESLRDRLRLVASRDGRDGSVTIHQDAEIWVAKLSPGARVRHELAPGRHAWVQVARGSVQLNGKGLDEGDGASASEESLLELTAVGDAEVLVFDLA